MIEREVLEALQPVVPRAVQLEHVELLLHELDEGQEAVALQPARIEIVRRPVGGRHHHHAALEQRR